MKTIDDHPVNILKQFNYATVVNDQIELKFKFK